MSNIIQISLWFARVFKWLSIILIGAFIVFLILALTKSNLTQDYLLELNNSTKLLTVHECVDCVGSNTEFFVNKLSPSMLIWLFAQLVIVVFCFFNISQQIILILKNFGSLKTFYEGNITSFRKMGFYALVTVPILAFKFISYYDPIQNYAFESRMIDLPFGPIAFALACFVLAEVFEQGRKLKEENESIL